MATLIQIKFCSYLQHRENRSHVVKNLWNIFYKRKVAIFLKNSGKQKPARSSLYMLQNTLN